LYTTFIFASFPLPQEAFQRGVFPFPIGVFTLQKGVKSIAGISAYSIQGTLRTPRGLAQGGRKGKHNRLRRHVNSQPVVFRDFNSSSYRHHSMSITEDAENSNGKNTNYIAVV
jgi:hypothetical protein